MRLDLTDLGCRVTGGSKDTVTLDASELLERLDRLRAAVDVVHAVWADLPPGVQRAFVCTIRLGEPAADRVEQVRHADERVGEDL